MCFLKLLGSEVVEEDVSLLRVLTPVLDNDARAADDLSGVTLTVELAKTSPLTELLSVGELDKRDVLFWLLAESLDKSKVGFLGDGVDENTEVGLTGRKSLGSLSETTGKTVVDKGLSQDTTEGVLDGHLSSWGSGFSGDFNLLDLLWNFFVVRLHINQLVWSSL